MGLHVYSVRMEISDVAIFSRSRCRWIYWIYLWSYCAICAARAAGGYRLNKEERIKLVEQEIANIKWGLKHGMISSFAYEDSLRAYERQIQEIKNESD